MLGSVHLELRFQSKFHYKQHRVVSTLHPSQIYCNVQRAQVCDVFKYRKIDQEQC